MAVGSELCEEPATAMIMMAKKRAMAEIMRVSLVFLSKRVGLAGAGLTEI